VHIDRLQGAIKYTVNSDLLFPSGSWKMSADGKDIIAKMAKTLAAGQQDKLIVNGYTDNAPIGPGLLRQGVTSNEILSQKRAEAVMQYMISQGVKPDMVTAKVWGDAQAVAPNTTPQGRAENRRVEITLAAS
jgi:chemotaxis protein MotB